MSEKQTASAKVIAIQVSPDAVQEAIVKLRESLAETEKLLEKLLAEEEGNVKQILMEFINEIKDLNSVIDYISSEFFSRINTEHSALIVPPILVEHSLNTRLLTMINASLEGMRNITHHLNRMVSLFLSSREYRQSERYRDALRRAVEQYIQTLIAVHISLSLNFERTYGALSLSLPPDKRSAVANMLFINRDIFKPK